MSRRYDYSSPTFGGCCVPPPSMSSSRDFTHRSSNRQTLVKQASIAAATALARADSSSRISRVDSVTSRAPLTRMDSNPKSPLARQDSSPRSPLTRMDSNPRSPLARQDSASSRFDSYESSHPSTYRPPAYVDRFRNFDLM